MSKKFTPEQTLHLVTLYREHECLWNTHSITYKNKNLKNKALQQMCADLRIQGFTVNDLKIKIKIIRSTYCIELDKIEKSVGTVFPYKPKVIWFDVLDSFIRDVTMRKKRVIEDNDEYLDSRNDDEPIQQIIYSEDDFFEDDESTQEDKIKYEEPDPLVKVTYGILLGDVPESTPDPPKRKIYQLDSTNNTVKLITDPTDESIMKAENTPKLRRIAPKPNEDYEKLIIPRDHTYHAKVHAPPRDDSVLIDNNKQDDEFDTFGKHVANQLRKLSAMKYIMAQEEIQSTITKFLMNDMDT